MDVSNGDVTLLLKALGSGDESAADQLLPLVYAELHRIARSYMQRERKDHTLQPTALINEAYLRLVGGTVDWQNRQHFIGVAANVMRRLLVDHARAHNAAMRSGGTRVDFEEGLIMTSERSREVLALHDELDQLAIENPRQAKIVELRYFGGFSVEATADILEMSPRSVKRDWALARIWLRKRMQGASALTEHAQAGEVE